MSKANHAVLERLQAAFKCVQPTWNTPGRFEASISGTRYFALANAVVKLELRAEGIDGLLRAVIHRDNAIRMMWMMWLAHRHAQRKFMRQNIGWLPPVFMRIMGLDRRVMVTIMKYSGAN